MLHNKALISTESHIAACIKVQCLHEEMPQVFGPAVMEIFSLLKVTAISDHAFTTYVVCCMIVTRC